MERNGSVTCYYWQKGFALCADSFTLNSRRPYVRQAITLVYAGGDTATVLTGASQAVSGRLILVAPNTLRRGIEADGSRLVIIDMPVATPEHQALSALLAGQAVTSLDAGSCREALACLDDLHAGRVAPAAVTRTITRIAECLCGQHPLRPVILDKRIRHVMEIIDDTPLCDISVPAMAEAACLSGSRLGHLFKEQTGCNLMRYARWASLWSAIWRWSNQHSISEVAASAGFYDSAHANRVFQEVFGFNPARLSRQGRFTLHRCDG